MTLTTGRSVGGGKKTRDRQRLAHLVTGLTLVAYVYAPGGPDPVLQAAVRWVLLPGVVASGVLMWQWPRVRRWVRSRGGRQ